jgi:outer membrane receptor protein involved in Fe transport
MGLPVRLLVTTAFCASVAVPAIAQQPIEERVVTARKRTERLQGVPISVSALSANQLYDINANDRTKVGF